MKLPLIVGMKKIGMLVAVVVLLVVPVICWAATFSFDSITNETAANVATGQAQLFVDVTDAGGGKVRFHFYNKGPNPSSITQIYFDDGTLLAAPSLDFSSGVSYIVPASAGNLPGGNLINFHTTKGFTADPTPPVQPNGVNPGEWVDVTFSLQSGENYADTLAALGLSLANPGVDTAGGLRIGIHVQGFANGGSESFGIFRRVPEPGTLILLGSGLLGLALAGGRKKFRK